ERTVIFKDDTKNKDSDHCPEADSIKLGEAKSFKFMLKQEGVYLYGKNNTSPECGEDHLSDKDPPTELCDSSSTSSDLTEEADGHWTWKCKDNNSDIKINCRTIIKEVKCGADHLSEKDPPTALCESPSTSSDLTEEADGYWTWKCKGEGSSGVEVSCRTLYSKFAECGADHLTHNNPPTALCESPSTSLDLTKNDKGSYTWKCKGEGSSGVEVSCKTLYPAGCTEKSQLVTNGVSEDLPNDQKGGTVDVATQIFNWDGVSEVSISRDGTKQDSFIFLDDSLLIENLSNGKSIYFEGTDHTGTNIEKPSIVEILQEGENELKYTAVDSDNDAACTGIGTLYLLWCEKYPAEQATFQTKPPSLKTKPVQISNPWPIFADSTEDASTEGKELGPLFYNTYVEDFNLENFNDKVKKIEFVNEDMKEVSMGVVGEKELIVYYGNFYGAVLFSNPSFSGKCFFMSGYNTDLKKEDKATGQDIDMSGDLSSMIVFKTYSSSAKFEDSFSKGSVELYATPNCGEDDLKTTDETGHKYDVCTLSISSMTDYTEIEKKIFGQSKNSTIIDPTYDEGSCPDKFIKKKNGTIYSDETTIDLNEYYDIQSFRINGSAGVVLKTDKGNCHYFDVKSNPRRGNCFANLQDTFKSFLGQEKAKTIMIIPLDQKLSPTTSNTNKNKGVTIDAE
ncbi:MAG: hypothetical protein PHR47_03835, partial [Candidatus Pacebacteria bacterium]|nr:hypothetical protein [Candidatus Paceibacterota bacterium]